jgi:hypothetical protein
MSRVSRLEDGYGGSDFMAGVGVIGGRREEKEPGKRLPGSSPRCGEQIRAFLINFFLHGSSLRRERFLYIIFFKSCEQISNSYYT